MITIIVVINICLNNQLVKMVRMVGIEPTTPPVFPHTGSREVQPRNRLGTVEDGREGYCHYTTPAKYIRIFFGKPKYIRIFEKRREKN